MKQEHQIKYGCRWDSKQSAMDIERACIQQGGKWIGKDGTERGEGLFTHYRNLITELWPEDDHHRWSDMILEEIIANRLTVLSGARDSGKTRTASKYALADYWCFPHNTLILMTSTDSRGLELRVWGDIKELYNRAKNKFSHLEGNVVDAKYGLFTDDITDSKKIDARNMRKGIIGVPCISSQGEFLGQSLKNFAGIKQERRRLVGDELQYIPVEYLKVLDAFDKGEFKAIFLGNPIANNGKALDRVAEPVNGWMSLGEPKKTTKWKNKYNGTTIALVGLDSPNFDPETKNKFPYLIDQGDVDRVAARPGGRDSVEWWSMIMGWRKAGAVSNRVLTMDMIENNGGFGQVTWDMAPTLKVYGVDAGYGGDLCVTTYIECGREVSGTEVMLFVEQKIVPIVLSSGVTAEDQIAVFVRDDCGQLSVPDSNVFVEAGMRATLAVSFGRVMSSAVNFVNAGGTATQRPVSNDLFVFDEKTQQRRLKTCYEHYSKFVTEMAFSVRAVVESGQARGFPRAAADEFELREWRFVYNDRYELETKDEYKKRTGRGSPNYSDSVAIAVEGARRLGFVIERLKDPMQRRMRERDWLEVELRKQKQEQKRYELNYKV